MCFIMKTCKFTWGEDYKKKQKKHHVLEFNQSQWLRPYIEFNTQERIKVEKKWRQRWKNVVHIDENYYIRKNMENWEKESM